MIRLLYYILFLWLGIAPSVLISQNEINQEVLNEIAKDIDYSNEKWTLVPRSEPTVYEPSEYEPITLSPFAQVVGYVIAIILLMAVIIAFLYFFSSPLSDKSLKLENQELNQLDYDPSHIDNIDPLPLLEQALYRGDYRLALRLRYIDFIKQCSDLSLIKWRPEKTNQEYLHELKPHVDFGFLSRLVLSYERVWFGKYNISKEDYESYAQQYDSLINQITAT